MVTQTSNISMMSWNLSRLSVMSQSSVEISCSLLSGPFRSFLSFCRDCKKGLELSVISDNDSPLIPFYYILVSPEIAQINPSTTEFKVWLANFSSSDSNPLSSMFFTLNLDIIFVGQYTIILLYDSALLMLSIHF